MTSKASNQRDITDVIKKQKREAKKLAGIARAQASGISGSDVAIASGQKTQAGGAGASNVTQDLLMNTYDIRDVDRLYFSTTAGSLDALATTDTGIESSSYYDSSSGNYINFGLKYQIPGSISGVSHSFRVGSIEVLDISDNNVEFYRPINLHSNTATGSYINGDMYYDGTDINAVVPAGTVNLTSGGGSGANATLSNLTSPTAINQDLNMGTTNSITFDTDKDTYIASTGLDDEVGIYTSNTIRIKVQNTKTIINNELSLLDGLTVGTTAPITFANNQEIQGSGGGIDYAVPSGDTHEFAVNSALKLTIAETLTTSSNDISMGGNDLEFGTGGTINFYSSASMASGGSATALPSNPTGYFAVKHQGNTRYIPFYS